MKYCSRYRLRIDENTCNECIFWKEVTKQFSVCTYNDWYPGLRKGREWTSKDNIK